MTDCPKPFVYTIESDCSPLVSNSIDLTKGLAQVVDSVKESTAVLRKESENIQKQLKHVETSVEESTEAIQKQGQIVKTGFNQVVGTVVSTTKDLVDEGKNIQNRISAESLTTRTDLDSHVSKVLDQLVKVMEGNVKAINSLKDVVSNLGAGSPLTDYGRLTILTAVDFVNGIDIVGTPGALLQSIETLAIDCGHFYHGEPGICSTLVFVQSWPFNSRDQPPRRGLIPVRAWALEREDVPGFRYIMGYTLLQFIPCAITPFGRCTVPDWIVARRNSGVRHRLLLTQLF